MSQDAAVGQEQGWRVEDIPDEYGPEDAVIYTVSKPEPNEPVFYFKSVDDAEKVCTHLNALESDLASVKAELEEARIEGIKSVIAIRCTRHTSTPPQNASEHNGGECGGCIAAERDALRTELEAVREFLGGVFDGNDFRVWNDWGEAKVQCYFCDWYSGDPDAEPAHDADCPVTRYALLPKKETP